MWMSGGQYVSSCILTQQAELSAFARCDGYTVIKNTRATNQVAYQESLNAGPIN